MLTKKTLKAALVRAIRTTVQVVAAYFTASNATDGFNLEHFALITGCSFVYSFCMALAGVPEVKNDGKSA